MSLTDGFSDNKSIQLQSYKNKISEKKKLINEDQIKIIKTEKN